MSCTASAAWSQSVSSPCYTEPGLFRGAILSGRITTVAISRSDQLGLRCTVEPNCSGMSARFASALVTRDRALDTCEPSCVPGAARPSLFLWSTARWGPWGMWQHRSSPLREAMLGPRGSAGAHRDREARSGAEERVAASELNSTRRRGPRPRGSTGAHLSKEVWSGAAGHVAAPEPTSAGRCGPKLQLVW
jgi:hypothetical protein